jgi:hypothetical protein
MAHHGGENLLRQGEIRGIERASYGRGKFGQVDQRIQQSIVLADVFIQAGFDALTALSGGKDNEVPLQLLFEIGYGHADARRAEPAVSARNAAGLHTGELKRDYGIAQQRHQPADGTDEARAALAGPVHVLGKYSFVISPGRISASTSDVLRPATDLLKL